MRHNRIRSQCLAAICTSALSSGCTMFPAVYGANWAEQVTVESGACPAIDGDYQNAGEWFFSATHGQHEHKTISLAHLLNGWKDAEGRQADNRLGKTSYDPAEDAYQMVSLRHSEGRLHIEASPADGSSRSFDLPTRDRCQDSTVALEASWSTIEAGIPINERRTLALGRAEDGSLLVYRVMMDFSFLVPFPIHSAAWFRFPPVAPAPEQLAGPTT